MWKSSITKIKDIKKMQELSLRLLNEKKLKINRWEERNATKSEVAIKADHNQIMHEEDENVYNKTIPLPKKTNNQ